MNKPLRFIWFDQVWKSINCTHLIMMPLGCTSKCQPLEVCIDKPFKGVLCTCWEDYVADIVTNLSEEEQNSEKFKRPSPFRQAIVNWVAEVFSYLHNMKKNGK